MTKVKEETEMTDAEVRLRYGSLVQQAAIAFSIDANYSAEVIRKAKLIKARRTKTSGT